MGEKSTAQQILAGRPQVDDRAERQMALFDAEGSSVLRSAADKLPGFEIRARGRPKGRKSRDTAQLLALVERRMGTDPLLWFADWGRLTPREVARVLDCTPLEAAEFQRKVLGEVNAYCRGRPVQVQLTGKDGESLPVFAPMFVQSFSDVAQAAGWGLPEGTVIEGVFDALADAGEDGVTDGSVTDEQDGGSTP
jgi:hypothetical protein